MKTTPETHAAYAEFVYFAPVFAVVDSIDERPLTEEDHEIIGEQIAEIANERALGGSLTATSDAHRIWRFQRVERAVRYFAEVAPAHAEAAHDYINSLWI